MRKDPRVAIYIEKGLLDQLQEESESADFESISELFCEIIQTTPPPKKSQMRVKHSFNIDPKFEKKLQKISDKYFNGNRSAASKYLVCKYFENQKKMKIEGKKTCYWDNNIP